jgi:hypothetical protein
MSNSDLIIPTDASSFQAGLLPSSLTGTSFIPFHEISDTNDWSLILSPS